MEREKLTPQMIERAIQHLNQNYTQSFAAYAQSLGRLPWAKTAEVTEIDENGLNLAVQGNGQYETLRVNFTQPVTDLEVLRTAMSHLAQEAHGDGGVVTAQAQLKTEKALRYLKALCNHFNRKVEAGFEGVDGWVNFPFGNCTLHAEEDSLLIHLTADNPAMLTQVKGVVSSHLEKFAVKENLQIEWEHDQITGTKGE